MARELAAILKELNNVYNPQRDVINQQKAQIDPMMQAETKGLNAAKEDAFGQITDQSNRRGLFYSGIPLAEEQKYTGSTYLPALANLRGKYAQQRFNLQDSLAKIQAEQYNQAYGIRNTELDREESARQAAAARASASAGGGWSPGGGDSESVLGAGTGGYGMGTKKGGGFAFVDPYGRPVSAAVYSQKTGVPFRELLSQMASKGDNWAKQALGFVGGDYGYDPNKIRSGNNQQVYQSLTWGGAGKALPQAGGGAGGRGW